MALGQDGSGSTTANGNGAAAPYGSQQVTTFRTLSSSFRTTAEPFRVDGTTRLPTGLGVLLSPDGNLVTGNIAPTAAAGSQHHHVHQNQHQHPTAPLIAPKIHPGKNYYILWRRFLDILKEISRLCMDYIFPPHHSLSFHNDLFYFVYFVVEHSSGAPEGIMTSVQQQMIEQYMLDRERQASSLAAAGMVVEQVVLNQDGQHHQQQHSQQQHPQQPNLNMTINVNAVDYDMVLGDVAPLSPTAMEEMETDFSKMFDSHYELQNMETEGSGWPTMNNITTDGGVGGANSQPNI